jgi:hexosaminidase
MKLTPTTAAATLLLLSAGMIGCRPEALPDESGAVSAASRPLPTSVIPRPARVVEGQGAFTLDRDARIVVAGNDVVAMRIAQHLAGRLQSARGFLPTIDSTTTPADGAIILTLDPSAGLSSDEAYTLDITRDGVQLTAGAPAGLFYGAVTLWQLATADGGRGPAMIAAQHIEDAPRFAWRGFMLDSARHFQSTEQIKTLLDAMAQHKLNVFHWHLTDDQGWRIEIKRYPKLIEVGGCRIPAGDGGIDPVTGAPRPYCGFYTQDQIREIVAYAAERHITVVPEIDVPGHAQAAIAAYPELGVLGDAPPVLNEWGVNSYLFNTEESTFAFLENVLAEVVELFPGTYVHIGGDEAVKDQWESSARVQARIRELGVGDEEGMQGHLVTRLEKFLAGHGKRLVGWDEILASRLPAEATVMSWRGIEGGIEAARKGHDVVMSPSSEVYFDYLQTDSPHEPPGRPATIPLQQVYAFEPVPDALDDTQRKHILGLQANMWTEHSRTAERVEHNVFPRLAAVAETAWTPAADKDYADFLARLPAQLRRYRMLGIDYATTPFQVDIDIDGDRKAGSAQVGLTNPLGYEVRYTTDGSAPRADSPVFAAPFEVSLPAQVRAAAFFDGEPLAAAREYRFDAASLLSRSDEQLSICPDTGRLLLRLEDDGPAEGERAIFNVTIFYPCWQWNAADLDGIDAVRVRLGRMPYYFQLAHDEPHRTFEPASTAHGELVVRGGGCEGELLAEVPMPATTDADGFTEVIADLPDGVAGRQDLCLLVTGDTRPWMWVVDRVTLQPGAD